MDFALMMALEPHGTDVFVGTGPQYPWGGLYGGQIVAQGLRAAQLTVDDEFVLHSIHAYFIRMGDHTEPVRFEVDRLRNGRSFCTRRVVARQATGAILNLACSFQRPEEGSVLQTVVMPDVAGPEGVDDDSWSPMFERRPALPRGTADQPGAWAGLWMRTPGPVEPSLAHAALAYLSDDVPTDAVLPQHPEALPGGENHERFMVASLDHADLVPPGLRPGRVAPLRRHLSGVRQRAGTVGRPRVQHRGRPRGDGHPGGAHPSEPPAGVTGSRVR